MHTLKSATTIALLVILMCHAIFAQRGRLGRPPLTGDPEERRSASSRFLISTPQVAIFEEDNQLKARLTLQTTRPFQAAYCYYGRFLPHQKIPTPTYRHFAQSNTPGPATEQEIILNLTTLFYAVHDVDDQFTSEQGGTVCYRIALPEIRGKGLRFYDSRFQFHQQRDIVCIIEGPWVDFTGPQEVTITWHTDRHAEGWILLDSKQFTSPPGCRHEISVSGLQGVEHQYQVFASAEDATVNSRIYSFRLPAQSRKFLFAALSDSRSGLGGPLHNYMGVNYATLKRLIIGAAQQDAQFIIFAGDLINGHTTDELDYRLQMQAWKQAVEPVGHHIPIFEGMGNHDLVLDFWSDPRHNYGIRMDKVYGKSSEELFAELFANPDFDYPRKEHPQAPPYQENVYYYDWDNCRFISLNTNYWWAAWAEDIGGNIEGYILANQMNWFKRVLKEAAHDPNIDHIFIFTHEPPFPAGGHLHDAMWYSGGSPRENRDIDGNPLDRSHIIDARDEFWEALANNGKVRAVITGDEHNYHRILIDKQSKVYPDGTPNPDFSNPVYLLISGGAGAPYYAQVTEDVPWKNSIRSFSAQSHYLLFGVEQQDIYLFVISLSQEIIEAVQIVKSGQISNQTVAPTLLKNW